VNEQPKPTPSTKLMADVLWQLSKTEKRIERLEKAADAVAGCVVVIITVGFIVGGVALMLWLPS